MRSTILSPGRGSGAVPQPHEGTADMGGPPCRPDEGPTKKVRVAVRVRPLLPQDGLHGGTCLADAAGGEGPSSSITVADACAGGAAATQYRVDSCWGACASGRAIFDWEVAPLVRDTFCSGLSATVFTHGASGSGKSHTMQGTAGDPGVVPLAAAQLLALCEAAGDTAPLRLSFFEVYLDRCYDLLHPQGELPLREDACGDVHLPTLSQVPVTSPAAFEALWAAGCSRRHTAATAVNGASSRSHSVLTLRLPPPRAGQLTLIDLAGFEDNRRTGNGGERLLESSHINSSLFTLHKVLAGLTSGDAHVAYRDSKLTRLLRATLASPGRALLLLCLAPGRAHAAAAHASLALAGLTRQVRLPPTAPSRALLPVSPQAPTSPPPAAGRFAALHAWQQAKGRTPRLLAHVHMRVCTPLPASAQVYASATPGAAPASAPVVPPDAAARLAHVEALLAHRCQAAPPHPTASPQATPPQPDGTATRTPLYEGAQESEQADKENRPTGFPPHSPGALCGGAACGPCGLAGARTPLQQLRHAHSVASRQLERECLAVLNEGDRRQLLCLRGIGAKRADAILALRGAAGGGPTFRCKEDLAAIGLRGKQLTTMFELGLLKEKTADFDLDRKLRA